VASPGFHRLFLVAALAASGLACGRDDLAGWGVSSGDAGPRGDATISDTAFDGGRPDTGGRPDAAMRPDAAARPDATMPSDATTFPDASRPDASRPDASRPDASRPDAAPDRDAAEMPDVTTLPDASRSDASRPDASRDASRPDADDNEPDASPLLDATMMFPDVPSRPDIGVRPDATPFDTGFDGGAPDAAPDSGPDGGSVCPFDCALLDDECNIGACNSITAQCVRRPRPPNTPCDDGDVCTNSVCRLGACVPIPIIPAGDSCASPIPLMIAPGAQMQGGSTLCALDDATPQCAGPGGRDLIFQATFAETRRIRARTVLTSSGSASFDTVLYSSRNFCPSPVQFACNDDVSALGFSEIDAVYPGGSWFFVVDGAGPMSSGDFELDIEVDPHDTCASPSILTVPPVGQTSSVRGNTSGNANDFQAMCGANGPAPDQVYEFTVRQPTTLRLETINPGPPFMAYDTVLYVMAATCGTGMTIACDDDLGDGSLSMIERSFAPGTYYVVVDGFGGNQGEYRLDITQVPALTTTILPEVGDARQPLVGPLTNAGQFVEGIRFFAFNQASRIEIDLQVNNNLICGQANFRVRINNNDVGTFIVRPNQLTVSQTLNFPSVAGPNGRFNIRYELQQNIAMNCGSVDLPNSVSTVGLGP